MSQNLTQPEEIDLIMRALEHRDPSMGTSLHEGRTSFAADISPSAERAKSIRKPGESHPYVWSM